MDPFDRRRPVTAVTPRLGCSLTDGRLNSAECFNVSANLPYSNLPVLCVVLIYTCIASTPSPLQTLGLSILVVMKGNEGNEEEGGY